ncbi:outer membrane lipid asymmetry maintenance protein MlaD [Paracoccus sp. M683]|uniref:outer membrane lipid asymmetry maintenance protein MlaD n=1 Tax=Paracoccus sp. M683 TaxID=2594268 RepID=UPI00117E1529|nr:outer membrane lipid asymmetry maintenance protein MlaD [Paracoccus sp. M683]TRW95763.1 outer membrane lipid asymmetry maintenance protein MlaD [Paracoccus sp. M683]
MSSSAEQRAELIAGAAVLAVALGFLGWSLGRDSLPGGGGYDLIASFPDVDGVEIGTEVRLAGVRVGRVTDLRLNPQTYHADAVIRVPDQVLLPSDSAALIQSDGLLGGAYIQLQPGGSPDNLAPGDEIEDVQGAVSLISLMMKFVDSQASAADDEGVAP